MSAAGKKTTIFRAAVALIVVLAFAAARMALNNRTAVHQAQAAMASTPAVDEASTGEGAPIASGAANMPAPASRPANEPAPQATAKHAPAATKTSATPASDESILKAIGSKTAPVEMEIFSDYQCPTCGAFYEQTLKPLINDYVASGKVYLVHRDFPLPMHKYSYEAARWINAAAKIGRYPEAEQALYDNQAAWSADGDIGKFIAAALSPADFARVKKMMENCPQENAGITPASLTQAGQHACPFDASIEKDKALGNTVPVSGTPTFRFYYKGKTYGPMSGFVSWPIMKQFLDQVLSQ
jgi:protein-disulfide isomerase